MVNLQSDVIPENAETHAFILSSHERSINVLRERTHDLKNQLNGLATHVKVMHESLSDIKSFQSRISENLEKITDSVESLEAVRNIITTGKFWIFTGWITIVGIVVILDNVEHARKVLGF